MAKKTKAVYAPGELSRVRSKLGELDLEEAKRMAQILGGEVGVEKTASQIAAEKRAKVRHETVDVMVGGRGGRNRPKHRVELASMDEGSEKKKIKIKYDPSDDPAVPVKTSYRERVKMDRYAGQTEFDIKTSGQVFYSMISIFGDIVDYVSPAFVTKRMNDYYKRIELLVTSTRTLFPRNNLRRNERLRKTSPLAFSVLDTIRYWNIERIAEDLARIQARPRQAKVSDFADILRAVYKPLFILEHLDPDTHIKESYKLIYKILYLENPNEAAKDKYQELIRAALSSLGVIRRDVHYLLYPLLLKTLSDRWLPYELFFMERRNRFIAFLNVAEENQLYPSAVSTVKAPAEGEQKEETPEAGEEAPSQDEEDDPETEEQRAKRLTQETEKKAVDRGLQTLEALFPKAGWDRFSFYPDLYPYFFDVFGLRKGYELLAPTDPLQQIAVLMRIIEELFFGLRYVSFGTVIGADGNPDRVNDGLGDIQNNWHSYIENSFEKEYLPRLVEYCRILDSSSESRTSNYVRRILNELYWAKRLHFLPYYKFDSTFPPPFQKKDIIALYPEFRKLRKYLTAVAAGIEQGNKLGGADAQAPCDGIDNPWDPYVFQVPNPVSRRLDMLLSGKRKNNASLIFFTLAVVTVLDYLVNNENSWAYSDRPGPLFRSVNGEGIKPLFGVDTRIDTETLFKDVMKRRRASGA
ncbi:MAG: hypothetical protein LBO80_11930 [Treponema sp.]|jgi:hypothetical protein|nr:hypothetical protein [Treponema sp.]